MALSATGSSTTIPLASVSLQAQGEVAMVALGQQLGNALPWGTVLFLEGTLGAGKTTLSRGVLAAFGHSGAVKSPTYTLVEPYDLANGIVYHFDLYRLGDPEELEFMGIRDYFTANSVCLIEWPARGAGILPPADIVVEVTVANNGEGRDIVFSAYSELACSVINALSIDTQP